jgi:CheY-like chemotaxis protein
MVLLSLKFAFSGNEALEIMEKSESKEVMYIFSDINMPGMTGLELLDKLKGQISPDSGQYDLSVWGF